MRPATSTFGPYRIIAPLGAGGMGEVYRAWDQRLDRHVAVKILVPELAEDPIRQLRFEQEARSTSSLNHPNIVAVYDVGTIEGVFYIVTELVEGESLRTTLEGGAIGLRQVLDIAGQLAEGLSAAHAVGIVHRDLKPDNIMLTPEGRVKILDFGLARHVPDGELLPVLTESPDEPAMLVGTVGYIAPEQIRGFPADHRSDIFSFGVVLYEMLSGQQPFRRPGKQETLEATLRDEPPGISGLALPLPPPLDGIIRRCLEKGPDRRFQSAADLAYALRSLSQSNSSPAITGTFPIYAPVPDIPIGRPRRWDRLLAVGAISGTLAAFFSGGAFFQPNRLDLASYTFQPVTLEQSLAHHAVFSPDGKQLLYNAPVDGVEQVFARSLESSYSVQISRQPGGCEHPFWSSDQTQIYCLGMDPSGRFVVRVGISGGNSADVMVRGLGGTPGTDGVALAPDGRTLVFVRPGTEEGKWMLWTASQGGATQQSTGLSPWTVRGSGLRFRLRFSPDGKQLLVVVGSSQNPVELWLIPWSDGQPGPGAPTRLLRNLTRATASPSAAWLPDSQQVLLSLSAGVSYSDGHLWLLDVQKEMIRLFTVGSGTELEPAVAPSGRHVLYNAEQRDSDLVALAPDGSSPRVLLNTARQEHSPAWLPTGNLVAYVTDRSGPEEIWLQQTQEKWNRPVVTPASFPQIAASHFGGPVFSPDGTRLAFVAAQKEGLRLWIVPVAGGTPTYIAVAGQIQSAASWSPDGQWLVCAASQSGRTRLIKIPATGQGPGSPIVDMDSPVLAQWSPTGEWITASLPGGFGLISPDGQKTRLLPGHYQPAGGLPHGWSRDGKTLHFLAGDASQVSLYSLDVTTGTERKVSGLAQDTLPLAPLPYTLRLSAGPDNGALATSVQKTRRELWTIEGFGPRKRLLERLFGFWR